jgi:hypothetical protein
LGRKACFCCGGEGGRGSSYLGPKGSGRSAQSAPEHGSVFLGGRGSSYPGPQGSGRKTSFCWGRGWGQRFFLFRAGRLGPKGLFFCGGDGGRGSSYLGPMGSGRRAQHQNMARFLLGKQRLFLSRAGRFGPKGSFFCGGWGHRFFLSSAERLGPKGSAPEHGLCCVWEAEVLLIQGRKARAERLVFLWGDGGRGSSYLGPKGSGQKAQHQNIALCVV